LSELGVRESTAALFGSLFAPYRSYYGERYFSSGGEPSTAIVSSGHLTNAMLASHLGGERSFVVATACQVGERWQARFTVFDLDYAGETAQARKDRALGIDGHQDVQTIRDACEQLGLPPERLITEFSGHRSLHLWVMYHGALALPDAYTIGTAISFLASTAGLNTKIEPFPTGPDRVGRCIALPWGRHPKTGQCSRFVDVGLDSHPRSTFLEGDGDYLTAILDRHLVPVEVAQEAAAKARTVVAESKRAAHGQARAKRLYITDSEAPAPVVVPAIRDPQLAEFRICMANLISKGAPEGHRNELGHILRVELKMQGLSLDQAWGFYGTYARNCQPSWPRAEALTDLEYHWDRVTENGPDTDPSKRHCCPGHGDGGPTMGFLRRYYCVGPDFCTRLRLGAFTITWQGELSPRAMSLYCAICQLEGQHALRPGDVIYGTREDLFARSGLAKTAGVHAREELLARGLVRWRGIDRKGPGGHTEVARVVPVPRPGHTCYDQGASPQFSGTKRAPKPYKSR
jgi:hypothetical protein